MSHLSAPALDIRSVARHRNGVSGAPFRVVLFDDGDSRKLAVVFDEVCHVAVLDPALAHAGEIRFGFNSFRGDLFEPALRAAVAAFEDAQALNHQLPGGTLEPE